MHSIELIVKKRNGLPLDPDEIKWLIENYVSGEIPDYQMSAFLMAVYFQGMTQTEIRALTKSMIHSGDTIDLSDIPGIKVDKHSTGGVGDKVSILLAPLVASGGVPVPMMAGRGLGHTGGTLDKLEAIPGFNTQLSEFEFIHALKQAGYAMIGQTKNIVPADKKLYALRDVTGTVPSIPLICSSIISKKKAEGTDALVLDVKVGKGAFLENRDRTLELAHTLVKLGEDVGIRTIALLTNMDQPLGNTVGNWLETREAIEGLQGKGPQDLMDVTYVLGSIMLVLGGKASSFQEAKEILVRKIQDGNALNYLYKSIELQGGDTEVIDRLDKVSLARYEFQVIGHQNGFVQALNAKEIGLISVDLGAGRFQKEDSVDPGAGLILHKKIGDAVKQGDVLSTCYTEKKEIIQNSTKRVLEAYEINENPVSIPPLIDILIDINGEREFL